MNTTFRIHYVALEGPKFVEGERHSADVDAKSPGDARKSLTSGFERDHAGCRPHILKVKQLREATR